MHSVLFCEAGQNSAQLLHLKCLLGSAWWGGLLRSCAFPITPGQPPVRLWSWLWLSSCPYSACPFAFCWKKKIAYVCTFSLLISVDQLLHPGARMSCRNFANKIKSRCQDSPAQIASWNPCFPSEKWKGDVFFPGVLRIKYGYQELSLGWALFTDSESVYFWICQS